MPKRGPTGTVTFLSSDIERSTQLVRELGSAAFTDAMEKHSRATRIAPAAHGWQVLISDATRSLVADALPVGVRLQPPGSYRLKDLTAPEELWQVEIRGLPAAAGRAIDTDSAIGRSAGDPTAIVARIRACGGG